MTYNVLMGTLNPTHSLTAVDEFSLGDVITICVVTAIMKFAALEQQFMSV